MKSLNVIRHGNFSTCLHVVETGPPQPSPGQVSIQVSYAGLNPHDCKLALGEFRRNEPKQMPYIPGGEVSGVVCDVGSTVSKFKKGDSVFGITHGGLAEICLADEANLAHLPKNVSPQAASGVSVTGQSVLQAFERVGGVTPGKKILIHAGSGGVGSFAIQYAKLMGAYVATTVSTRNIMLAKSLGADEVIDYTMTDPNLAICDYDIVLDTIGGGATFAAFEMVKVGGAVAALVPAEINNEVLRELGAPRWIAALAALKPSRLNRLQRRLNIRYKFIFMRPDPRDLQVIARLLETKQITPLLDRIVPFESAIEAFEYLATGRAKGKVIVDLRHLDPKGPR